MKDTELLKPINRSLEYKASLLATESLLYDTYIKTKDLFGENSEQAKATYHCWLLITSYEIDNIEHLIN